MSNLTYQNVHNRFKLNGFQLTRKDLCIMSSFFIKEGEDYEKWVGDFILDWFDNKPYIEMHTSGTTGQPKLIRIDKQAMVNSALATGDFFNLKPGDKVLHCLSTKFIAGKMMLVRGFILGLDLDLVAPNLDTLDYNETIYDFCAMVPLQVQNSLNSLHKVKTLIIGGAKVNSELEKKIKKSSAKVFETYGMTETITHIAAKKIGEEAFKVLANVIIEQDDRDCLVVTVPTVVSEKIITNDVVKLVAPDQFIWLGRIDNVINSGGIKLIPELIEQKLSGSIKDRFFVAGKEDATLGQKLILVIEGDKYSVDDSIFNILDKYEKPKEIYFVPKLEETESGKLQRKNTLSLL